MESLKTELFKEVFAWTLTTGEITVSFSGMDRSVGEIIEGHCYKALQKIKAIIQDDSLEDPACLKKIEEIVCALESIGSNGGGRHDFG